MKKVTTYQSIVTEIRKLGWPIQFDKATLTVVIQTPCVPVKMNVTGPLHPKQYKASTQRWVNEKNPGSIVKFILDCYNKQFPKRNVKKSNSSRANINKRKQQRSMPVV